MEWLRNIELTHRDSADLTSHSLESPRIGRVFPLLCRFRRLRHVPVLTRTGGFRSGFDSIESLKHESWWCTGIYASTDDNRRKQQWDEITRRKHIWRDKPILTGDMNDIVSQEEKWGGRLRIGESFRNFRDFIQNNQLADLGFVGDPWTWRNNWTETGCWVVNLGWICTKMQLATI